MFIVQAPLEASAFVAKVVEYQQLNSEPEAQEFESQLILNF
jgi:hypothetical protein